jgi:hypothetical protein
VHDQQKLPIANGGLGTLPTWNDLVEHTMDSTHNGWGDRLLVPMSNAIKVSKTTPRVAIELRRIGFASVYARSWPGLMRSVFRLASKLDA